jgi:porin
MKFAQSVEPAVQARSLHDSAMRGGAARRSRLPSLRRAALCTAFAWASLTAGVAMADANPDATPEAPEADLNIKAAQTDQWTGVWNRQTLLGDIGGLRPWLGKYGVTFTLTETSEVLANVRGGLARGADYDGLTTATVQMDTQKAFGLPGGLFNVSALQIHGANLSALSSRYCALIFFPVRRSITAVSCFFSASLNSFAELTSASAIPIRIFNCCSNATRISRNISVRR